MAKIFQTFLCTSCIKCRVKDHKLSVDLDPCLLLLSQVHYLYDVLALFSNLLWTLAAVNQKGLQLERNFVKVFSLLIIII